MNEIDINDKIVTLINSSLEKFFVKNFNDAIRDLKAAEVLDKNNPEILYNLGVNYAKLGLYKTSAIYFDRLLNLSYSFVGVLTVQKLMAFSLIKNSQFGNALNVLNNVIKLAPDDVTAYNMIGFCLEKQKNYFEAVKNYKTVIEIDRNNLTALNSLAYIYAMTGGDLDTALSYAKKVCESDKTNPAYMDTLGYIYLKLKNFKNASDYFARALALNPFSDEIRNHMREIDTMTA